MMFVLLLTVGPLVLYVVLAMLLYFFIRAVMYFKRKGVYRAGKKCLITKKCC